MAFSVRAIRAISSSPPVTGTRSDRSWAAMASTRRRIASTGARASPIPNQMRPPEIKSSSGKETATLTSSTVTLWLIGPP